MARRLPPAPQQDHAVNMGQNHREVRSDRDARAYFEVTYKLILQHKFGVWPEHFTTDLEGLVRARDAPVSTADVPASPLTTITNEYIKKITR